MTLHVVTIIRMRMLLFICLPWHITHRFNDIDINVAKLNKTMQQTKTLTHTKFNMTKKEYNNNNNKMQ